MMRRSDMLQMNMAMHYRGLLSDDRGLVGGSGLIEAVVTGVVVLLKERLHDGDDLFGEDGR